MNLKQSFLKLCENKEFEINKYQLVIIEKLTNFYNGNFKRSFLDKIFKKKDIKPGTKPLTIFISGPFGLRKGPRSEYGIDFKTKKD